MKALLPLPASVRDAVPTATANGNAGLRFDKYFDQWKTDAIPELSATAKSAWVKCFAIRTGDQKQLAEAADRRWAMVARRGGVQFIARTDGRLVSGLGREHPIENGFAWHHTLGTAFLPGSSVKGLLRAWARAEGVDPTRLTRLFGADQGTAQVGSVIVLDALPTQPVKLDGDVMTPHYAPYYADATGHTPPADWFDPLPIPCLAVASGQYFAFALLPRSTSDEVGDDLQQAQSLLTDALIWLGAGAKTAVGYGRFARDEKATQEIEQRIVTREQLAQQQRVLEANLAQQQRAFEASLNGLTPLAQELERAISTGRWQTDKNAFANPGVIESWLQRLEADPQPDAVRRLRGLVSQHFPGLLENPNKLEGKKQKPAFNDRQRAIAKRLIALQSAN